jgi:hypothetical protein
MTMRVAFTIVSDFPDETTQEELEQILAACTVQVDENVLTTETEDDGVVEYTIDTQPVSEHLVIDGVSSYGNDDGQIVNGYSVTPESIEAAAREQETRYDEVFIGDPYDGVPHLKGESTFDAIVAWDSARHLTKGPTEEPPF